MATLETIRTKAGVFISIIIGLALLSFIVNPDTFSMALSMFSSKNDVGKISGRSISYQEFDNRVNHITNFYRVAMGDRLNEEINDNIRNEAWNSFIRDYVFAPRFRSLGLDVTSAELTDLMVTDPVPMVRQLFINPQTGEFDRETLSRFASNLDADINGKIYWLYLEEQIYDNQLMQKYFALNSKSEFVNSLDVKRAVKNASSNVEFSYVAKNYDAIADSTIKITNSDLHKYYDNHKNNYEQVRGRDIEFVSFRVEPQAIDFERAAKEITEIEEEMSKVDVQNLGQFVTVNSEKPFDNTYYKKGELGELDSFAFSGKIGDLKPVYQIGNSYYVSRIMDLKILPDSVKAEQILLRQNADKTDSIIDLLNKGANFANLAREFSEDQMSSENGGDLGWLAFNQMGRPLSDSCFYQPKGKVMKVITQDGIHIIRVLSTKNEHLKAKVATVELTVKVGKETYSEAFNKANNIAIQSNKDRSTFNKVLQENGISSRKEYNIQLGNKRLADFSDARNLVKWIYEAKEGEVSDVIEIDDNFVFVVACLTKIKPQGIAPFEQVKEDVEQFVKTEKKAEKIKSEFAEALKSSTTIDEFAEKVNGRVVPSYSAINFNSSFIPSLMVPEPKLIGAVTAAKENKLTGPVDGEKGVYVFSVTSSTDNESISSDAEKMRIENNKLNQLNGVLYEVLIKKADITDNRGRFF